MKKIWYMIGCILLVGGLIYFLIRSLDAAEIRDYKIEFSKGHIYVRTMVWGISGGHEAIAFSSEPIPSDVFEQEDDNPRYKDSPNMLIYYQPEVFCKHSSDTLYVYSRSEGYGNLTKHSDVATVVPIECTDAEWSDYSENYKKYNMNKLDASEQNELFMALVLLSM